MSRPPLGWLRRGRGCTLAIAGVTTRDAEIVRAVYLAMHLTTWFVIIPFGVASLITGVIDSLGTTWVLFRHYWVATKLLLTVLATVYCGAYAADRPRRRSRRPK